MRTHRKRPSSKLPPSRDNRPAAVPEPEPEPDDGLDSLLDTLRDNMRRADAMVSTAERQIEESWHDDEDDEGDVEEEFDTVLRHRMRVEYLVEAGKNAVRAALYTLADIDKKRQRQRRSA